ncbi:cubilin-like [Haliotis rufescens]|uniref:cubilin-like n=1 Tax=Haliotis rufescens TaxID=6454 RepID=UPI001EB05BF5|nr:cubilin-like [Haliotis rufescens]
MIISCFIGVCVLLFGPLVSNACNVTLYAQREPLNFTSPNYPRNYTSNDNCYWDIYPQTRGYRVVLDMVFSDIEGSSGSTCRFDALTIYTRNNADQNQTDSHRICGQIRWNLITHANQHFHAVFETDGSVTRGGFLIRYYETDGESNCGLPLVATSAGKTFTSPGYPNTYFLRQSCTWTITTEQQNQTILMYPTDSVLERASRRGICDSDYVTVYNGQNSSDILGTFCGNERPVFSSGGNSLRVRLQTDSSNNYKGFKMFYRAVPATTCNGMMPSGRNPIQIVSPGYPNNYQSGLDCQWTINAPSGSNITVEVLFVDMEIVPSCTNDYLLFKDGTTNSARQLAKICERTSTAIVSSSNHMTIIFHSDSSDTGRGFRLQYSSVIAPICGLSDLYASSAAWTNLTSPGYPSNYFNNLNCLWTISAPAGYKIKVDVVYLIMQYSPACSKDYLLFSDGSTSYATRLGKYCGRGYNSREVVSSRNYMTITFHTDGSDTALGFRLNYKAGSFLTTTTERPNVLHCGGPSLSASKFSWRYLSSPGYPYNDYNNNMDCTWTITASVGYKIRVEIQVLSVEYEATCAKDYLLFSDGSSSYDTQLGKYCSGTRDVVSSNNDMTITFHTDGSGTGRGFSLKYTARRKLACGTEERIYGYDTKYIESPNYPLDYPDNSDCSWTISTDVEGYVIHVKEVYFYLEQDSPCSFDYVQLYDVRGTYEHSLGRWCGSDGPDTQSTGRSMKVRFLSDASSTFTGFKLAFTAGEPTSSSSFTPNVGAIMGGIFGGMVGVAIVTCCCCAICSRKKSTTNDQSQGNRSPEANLNIVYTVTLPNYPPTTATTQPDMFTPPPAYSEVVKDDPPPYCQAVPLSDIQPVVASSPSGASYQGIDNPAGPSRVTVSHDVHV